MRHVVAPALPDLHPACGLAGIARPFGKGQGCGHAGLTSRGRRAAQTPKKTAPGLGGPGSLFSAHTTLPAPLRGYRAYHARHSHALTPPLGRQKVELLAPIRTSTHQRGALPLRLTRQPGHRREQPGQPGTLLRTRKVWTRRGSPRAAMSSAFLTTNGSTCRTVCDRLV